MKKKIGFLFLMLLGGHAWAEETNILQVRMVGLFTSGVGYFQHAGTVSGRGQVTLSFQENQINDLLKSLVVEDLSGIPPDPVIYASRDPQERLLEKFHVNLGGNPSLANILEQIRGTPVRLQQQGEWLSGTLLGVEQRPMVMGEKSVLDWVLNLATETGLRVVPVKEMGLLELTDAGLRTDLQEALRTLDQDRGRNHKSLFLRFPGQGTRQVRVGYVVETPVWKTSYRLILPKKEEKARLQGWAIIENQSSYDWKGVRLFLVSGQPLSFTQNLYQPHYVTRPKIEAEEPSSIAPPRHKVGFQREKMESIQAPQAVRSMAMLPMEDGAEGMADRVAAPREKTSWETRVLRSTGVATATKKVGALFQFVIEAVDLPRQRGAMIPIISDRIDIEKVSIYNQKTLADHPLEGALLKNSTGKHLPAGPVTLFNGGFYAGDARMEDLPAGQERLLSYAVDQEVQVLGPKERKESFVTSGKIVGGVFILSHKQLAHQAYRLENHGKEVKTLIIEHPVRPGWTLVDTTDLMESSRNWHRFRRSLPSSEQTVLTVTEEQTHEQRMVLLRSASHRLFAQVRGGKFSRPLRRALEQAATLQQALESSQRSLDENKQRLENLKREQERIHANMNAVKAGTAFHNRMVSKLDEQETDIEKINAMLEKIRAEQGHRREALEHYLKNLNVE